MDIRQAITLIEAMSKFKPRLFAETPEFERWFSGSKVVDDSGKPLLCFHGTLENFDVFKLESERRRMASIDSDSGSIPTRLPQRGHVGRL